MPWQIGLNLPTARPESLSELRRPEKSDSLLCLVIALCRT